MAEYGTAACLRIAGRYGNPRRAYLLVNPLQAKHLPVSPHDALQMMRELGAKVAANSPDARLVIGFAETATAIGAAVARNLGAEANYVTTTREIYESGDWLDFAEEHSHAVRQRLCMTNLKEYLTTTDEVVMVDDEFSTGKTLLNIVGKLQNDLSAWRRQKITAASILHRLSRENEQRWQQNGIAAVCLLKLSPREYDPIADITAPVTSENLPPQDGAHVDVLLPAAKLPNPRLGVNMGEYGAACDNLSREVTSRLASKLAAATRILVLGTEECMYPSLILGEELEKKLSAQIFCHATTRSPIGVSGAADYPITSGYELPSLYDAARRTFVYNVANYDAVVIVTDAPTPTTVGKEALIKILAHNGCPQIYFIEAKNV